MLNDWFFPLDLAISWDEFKRLPRHPAYRYEYRRGSARLTGRPQYRQCQLSTAEASTSSAWPADRSSLVFQHPGSADLRELALLFERAFANSAPFDSLPADQKSIAATSLVRETLHGQHGPLVTQASLLLRTAPASPPVAASIITLVAPGNWQDFTDPAWQEGPPETPLESCWGHPHLTWLFVDPQQQRKGLGSFLLAEAKQALHVLGYQNLTSTFLVGDFDSQFWHWKQGFQLIPSRLRSDSLEDRTED